MGGGKAERSRHCLWALVAEEPLVFAWLRGYQLLKRFPSLPHPGATDPRTLEALVAMDQEYEALEPLTAKPPDPKGARRG